MINTSTTTLTMTRRFDLTAERVFDAWLNPDMMKKWFFTMESTNKVAKNEPRVGGTWEIVDHREGKDYRAVGKYIEVNPPSKLVFTFKMPQYEENWTAEDIEKALAEYNSQSEQGWGYMFEGLKQLAETGSIRFENN